MQVDVLNDYSNAQAETTIAVHDSTNIIDHGHAGNAIIDPHFVVQVPTAVTSAGAATVQIKLITATDEAFTSPVTLFDSGLIGKADLVQGARPVAVRLPKGLLQFSKVTYGVATAALTAGKFDAWLTPAIDNSFGRQDW